MAASLFTYGTLLFPQVIEQLVGRPLCGSPARLRGFARYRLRRRIYPAVIAQSTASTCGVLYEGLDDHSLARLDTFEGTAYERQRLAVELPSGQSLEAYVYVLDANFEHLLSDQPWDPKRFAALHLDRYLAALGRQSGPPRAEQLP